MRELLRFLLVSDPPEVRSAGADLRRIWLLSGVVGLLVLLLVPITLVGGGNSYLEFAKVLAGQIPAGRDTYFRTPAYPLLMIATGVLRFDSFLGLMLAQTLMAIAMPVLVYRIVELYGRRAAYYAALLTIGSLVPYGYQKSVLAEQPYVFVLLVVMYFAARVWRFGRGRDLFLMTAALFVLPMIKPVAAYLLVPLAAAAAVFLFRGRRRLLPSLTIAVVLFAILWPVATNLRNRAVGSGRTAVTALNIANGIGKELFYNIYLTGGHLNNDVMRSGGDLDHTAPFISDADGPAAREIRQALERSLTPDYVARTAGTLAEPSDVRDYFYGRFMNDPKNLVAQMLGFPSLTYYWYMWTALDDALGPQESDRLFLRLSIALLARRPLVGAKYLLRNLYFFASGVSIDYIYALYPNYNLKVTQSNLNGLVGFTPAPPPGYVLSPRQTAELRRLPGGEWNIRLRMLLFYHLWTPLYLLWRPLLFVGMLLGLWLLSDGPYAPIAWIGALVVVYHMLVVCVFVMPIDRYVTETILVELVVAVPAWIEALRRLVALGARLRLAAA